MGLRVIACDPNAERLQKAKELGAITFTSEECLEGINELTAGRGVEGAIVTTVATQGLDVAIQVLATNGTLVLYSSYGEEKLFPFDPNAIHQKELTITGSEGRSGDDFHQAVRLLAMEPVTVAI